MSRFALTLVIVYIALPSNLAFADEAPAAKSRETSALAERSEAPVTERSFFESRTLEDIQEMVKFDVEQFEDHVRNASSKLGT